MCGDAEVMIGLQKSYGKRKPRFLRAQYASKVHMVTREVLEIVFCSTKVMGVLRRMRSCLY